MLLNELLASTPVYQVRGLRRINITGLSLKPSEVKPHYLYIHIDPKRDVREAVDEAIRRGAAAVCVEQGTDMDACPVTVVRTYHMQRFLSAVSRNFYHNPSQYVNLVAITGSQGKTTVSDMIASILRKQGSAGVVLGKEDVVDQSLDSIHMNAMLQENVGESKVCLLECSYTGIVNEQFRHILFDSVIYTNLYTYFQNHDRDDECFEMRKTLLEHLKQVNSPVIINQDDYYASQLRKENLLSYSIFNEGDVNAYDIELTGKESRFLLIWPGAVSEITLRAPGLYNVYNALAAAAWSLSQGIDLKTVTEGLFAYQPPAREAAEYRTPIRILADNVCEPERLKRIMTNIGHYSKRPITVVFCVGDCRDMEEYMALGRVIDSHAAQCIFTADYFCRRDTTDTALKLAQGMRSAAVSHELDHSKALSKAVETAQGIDGEYILVISPTGYAGQKRISQRLTQKTERGRRK
jgi:UDP-N-acetylmuramoyl-L-alanyl-D-glutamate--2,6-diaminopimelate ligase